MARHIRKGDNVIVTAGDHKGNTGELLRVDTKTDRVFIKGVNMVTKRLKANRDLPQGAVITKEASIHLSNVSPVVDGKPTRVRFKAGKDGSKVRIAVRNGKELGTVRAASK